MRFGWFGQNGITGGNNTEKEIEGFREALATADAVVVGAGAGLSTSAGFVYTGERFARYFRDFAVRYGFRDMYSGGFAPFSSLEEQWAYWSRYIYINRIMDPPKPVYDRLRALLDGRTNGADAAPKKDYFVITTNVDHCFQKAGFDKERLFYTQGDYGLWQCSRPCHEKTYDNGETVRKMVIAQGFTIAEDGALVPPSDAEGATDYTALKMEIPSDLVPYCPVCGEPMSMNLRADDTFVEDDGWHEAAAHYHDFLKRCEARKTLYLDLGCGSNTPGIFKYPFWQMTAAREDAVYVCINRGEAYAPAELHDRAICIDSDIGEVLVKPVGESERSEG